IDDAVELMRLIVERNKVAQWTEVAVVFDSQRAVLQVVSHARCRREIEAFEAALPRVIENRIDDDIHRLQMPSDDRPNFGCVPILVPMFRVVAEFEIRAIKELAIIGSGRRKQKTDLPSVDLRAEIFVDAIQR